MVALARPHPALRRATAMLLALALGAMLGPAAATAAPVTPAAPTCDDVVLDIAYVDDPPPPVGTPVACGGIRPGARVLIPTDDGFAWCTQAFIYHGTSIDEEGELVDEGLFMSTAGHCVSLGETHPPTAYPDGTGPLLLDVDEQPIGRAVFSTLATSTQPYTDNYLDFALVRIDPARLDDVNPAMCHFGGPVGTAPSVPPGTVLHHYGQGLTVSDVLPARSAVTVTDHERQIMTATDSAVLYAGALASGDSGSGVRAEDGRALAIHSGSLAGSPVEIGALLSHMVPLAETTTGISFELVEGPLAP